MENVSKVTNDAMCMATNVTSSLSALNKLPCMLFFWTKSNARR